MIYKASVAVSGLLLILLTKSALATKPCPPQHNPQPNPQSRPQPRPEPNPKPNPQSSPKPNPQPNPQPSPKPDPQSRPQPSPQPNPQSSPQPNPQPNPQSSPQPNPQPNPQSSPPPNPQPNPQSSPPPNPQPSPQPNPQSSPQPNPQSSPQTSPQTSPQPNPQTSPQPSPQPNPQEQPKKKDKTVGNLVPISIPLTGARRVEVGHTDFSGSAFAGGGTFSSAGVEGTLSHRLSEKIFLFEQATYNPAAPSNAIGVGGLTAGVVFNAPGESLRHNSYIGVYSNILGFGNTGGDDISQTAFGNLGIIGGVQRPVGERVSVFGQAEAAQRLYSLAKSAQGQAARISGGMSLALSCTSGVSFVGDYTVGSNQYSEWGLRGVFNYDFFGTACGVRQTSAASNVVKVTKYVVTLIGANPTAEEITKAGLTPPNANPEKFRLQSERWTGEKAQVVEQLVFDAVEVEGVPNKILFVRKSISPKAFEKAQQLAADREPKKAFEEIRKLLQAEEQDKTFKLEEEVKRIANEKGMTLSSVQKVGYAFNYQNRLLGVVDSDLSQPLVGKLQEVSPAELMLVQEVVRKGNRILPSLATGYTTKGTTIGGNSIVNGNLLPPGTRVQVPKNNDVIVPVSIESGASIESPQIQWTRVNNK